MPAESLSTFYRAFGLTVQSCMVLPEVLATEAAPADVTFSYGTLPVDLPDAVTKGVRYQAAPGKLLLRVDGIARFLVTGGKDIVIERVPGAEDDDVRLFLLGSALGALLHQREDLVLHGSAIAVGDWSAAFVGISGAGKSTLAMAFRKKGYPIITDDLCVVRSAEPGGLLLAHPGPPQGKLWMDSLKKLEIDPENLRRLRAKLNKRALPLGESAAVSPLPLRKIYVLRPNNKDELKLTSVDGPAKFSVLKNNTYRFGFVGGLGGKPAHFQQAVALAQQAKVSVAIRPREPFQLDELVALIEADLKA